ncbi:histidine phosphatase family protein [Streptomyces sp. NPDC096324]|uniref:histidine phosphatase family protein n=1 Tax=Streptomyces sp. NPDC096324 TaxID=3366085 RepID=UPI0038146C75
MVLVTHGNLIRVLTVRWLGLPGAAGANLALCTAPIGRLALYDARPSLLGWNFSPTFDMPLAPPPRTRPAPGDPVVPATGEPRGS